MTVVDHDGARAREHARRRVAMYLDVVAALDPTVELDPELLVRIARARRGAGRRTARRGSSPTSRSTCFAFAGTPAQIAGQAEALFDAGARRVEFGSPARPRRARGRRAARARGRATTAELTPTAGEQPIPDTWGRA